MTAATLCADAVASTGGPVPAVLAETSGIVASRAHPGVLWAHDDSGGAAEVVAAGLDGDDRGRVAVAGATAVDWEDIALVPGVDGAPDRLVLADIGDNFGRSRAEADPVLLYVVDEPVPPGPGATGEAVPAESFHLIYADGARDAETLLADPRTGDLFVVSKQWDGTRAGAYRVPAGVLDRPGAVLTMTRDADVGDTAASLVTGGDVAPDGSMIALRTYADIRLWDRSDDETVDEALAGPPVCTIPVDEPQGEAVAFTADGRGLVTVSEGAGAPVLRWLLP